MLLATAQGMRKGKELRKEQVGVGAIKEEISSNSPGMGVVKQTTSNMLGTGVPKEKV